MKKWKQSQTEIQNGEAPVITEQMDEPQLQNESLFWKQLESLVVLNHS